VVRGSEGDRHSRQGSGARREESKWYVARWDECGFPGVWDVANSGLLVTLNLSDDDFAKLYTGKANAQNLFMKGKLKIKGDVMKATKLDPILKKAQTKAKL
jgi:hypothetical protein